MRIFTPKPQESQEIPGHVIVSVVKISGPAEIAANDATISRITSITTGPRHVREILPEVITKLRGSFRSAGTTEQSS